MWVYIYLNQLVHSVLLNFSEEETFDLRSREVETEFIERFVSNGRNRSVGVAGAAKPHQLIASGGLKMI